MYYVLCFFFFFALFPPQNGLVGRNLINTEKNGSSALDGRLGSHSDFFRCPYGRPASYGWCQMVPGALASNQNLRSSSKYVSLPSAPGTEQIRRVFRNVVHLFTRLLWPPMSFWLKTKESRFKPCWISHLCQSGRCLLSPCRAGRCASRWTSPAPGPPPPSHGRRKTPCRHRGFRSPEPRRSQQTLVLEGKGSVSASDFRCNGDFMCDWLHEVMHGPFSQRESCCSVRMDGRLPMLLKMVKSRPIRSVATPAYSSSPRRRIEMVTRLKLHFIEKNNYFSPSIWTW